MSVRRAHSSGPQQRISPAPGLACKFVKSTHQGKATATGQELRLGVATVAPRHHTVARQVLLSYRTNRRRRAGRRLRVAVSCSAAKAALAHCARVREGSFPASDPPSLSGEGHTVDAPGQVVKEPNVTRAKTEDAIRTLRGLPPPEGSFLPKKRRTRRRWLQLAAMQPAKAQTAA